MKNKELKTVNETVLEFKVEKGIEIPKKKTNAPKIKYPFDEMGINDSFEVKCTLEEKQKIQSRLRGAANCYTNRIDEVKAFTVRNTINGVRIWRTK